MNSFAYIFRSVNAKLITTNNFMLEKILKLGFALSLFVYRRFDKTNVIPNPVVVINNFDSTISMKIDRSRSMGAALYWTGFHEFNEFIFLHHYLKPSMVFADVGANQGEYSLFAAKRLTEGKVLAFEPLPSIRKVLEENIQLNEFKNIQVFDFGLSDKESTLEIHEIEDVHEGLATFYPGSRKSKAAFAVPLKTLDSAFHDLTLYRLDFIKIDIEGGELKALQGSTEIIKKFKPTVMVEVNEETYRAAGYTSKEIGNFFDAVGYLPYEIKKRGRLEKCIKLPVFGNVIFMPQ